MDIIVTRTATVAAAGASARIAEAARTEEVAASEVATDSIAAAAPGSWICCLTFIITV